MKKILALLLVIGILGGGFHTNNTNQPLSDDVFPKIDSIEINI